MGCRNSDDLEITAGAYQSTRTGAIDVAVIRLDDTGALVASTYYGAARTRAPMASR
jgi:hypothetical protein